MRILVIEDEHKIAKAIKKGLEQQAYAVDIANDGEEGYDLASTEEYDLIILDLMLPKMDGVSVCKNLRGQKIQTPILMLTAKSQVDDKVTGLNSGADDYLAKPFAFSELIARVKALGRRPKNALGDVFEISGLEIDTNKLEVTRDNIKIKLSKTEYSLLEYLVRNKGKTLSKDQIINAVWNYDADILPNTVEVYIGYLRSKIDKPFKNKAELIKTVRGFGYKIE